MDIVTAPVRKGRRDGEKFGLEKEAYPAISPKGAADPPGLAHLKELFCEGVRLIVSHRLGKCAAEPIADEVLRSVAGSLRPGDFRRPHELRLAVLRAARLRMAAEAARRGTEARRVAARGKTEMAEYLRKLPATDREALVRFFVGSESADQICRDIRISRAAFRRLREQARARFREISRSGAA